MILEVGIQQRKLLDFFFRPFRVKPNHLLLAWYCETGEIAVAENRKL
jgi:hypothetical protein